MGSNATLLSTGIQMSPNALWAFMWINKSLYLWGNLTCSESAVLGRVKLTPQRNNNAQNTKGTDHRHVNNL